MDIRYREARPEDVPECVTVHQEAWSDVRTRHNLPVRALTPTEETLANLQHVRRTGIFYVAESGTQIVAYACAIMREALWFLAGFWARPHVQGQGIGKGVLRRVWDAGLKAGATRFFVWSSIDLPAIAAYMKIGMVPGCQLLFFEGAPQPPIPAASGDTVAPLDPSFAMDLDAIVLGTRRELDHAFFSASGSLGKQVLRGGQPIGYYYLKAGRIGPAAWTQPEYAQPLLAAACREAAATNSAPVGFTIPGMNHAALRFAFDSGLRLQSYSHLLMSAPFGRLEQYLPSGPALF